MAVGGCCDYKTATKGSFFAEFGCSYLNARPSVNMVGNALSAYWQQRAIAELGGERFRIEESTYRHQGDGSPVSFVEFLPADVPPPSRAAGGGGGGGGGSRGGAAAAAAAAAAVALARRCGEPDHPHVSPHACIGSFTAIMPSVRRDTLGALRQYLSWPDWKPAQVKKQFELRPTDAVVHFRCGDIVSSDHIDYALLPFPFYTSVIPDRVTRVIVVGNFRKEQSGQGWNHEEAGGMPLCRRILTELKSYILAHKKTVQEVVEASVGFNEDFALLTKAAFMIASISTYSFWAGLVNDAHGTVVLPWSRLLMECKTPKLGPGVVWARSPFLLTWRHIRL